MLSIVNSAQIDLYLHNLIKLEERLCEKCNVVENEFHFIIECQLYRNERRTLFEKIKKSDKEFETLPNDEKFSSLFQQFWKELCLFLEISLPVQQRNINKL